MLEMRGGKIIQKEKTERKKPYNNDKNILGFAL